MISEEHHTQRKGQYLRLVFLAIALLASLGLSVFWILTAIRAQVNKRLASSLETVLETTDKAMQNWAEQTEINSEWD